MCCVVWSVEPLFNQICTCIDLFNKIFKVSQTRSCPIVYTTSHICRLKYLNLTVCQGFNLRFEMVMVSWLVIKCLTHHVFGHQKCNNITRYMAISSQYSITIELQSCVNTWSAARFSRVLVGHFEWRHLVERRRLCEIFDVGRLFEDLTHWGLVKWKLFCRHLHMYFHEWTLDFQIKFPCSLGAK